MPASNALILPIDTSAWSCTASTAPEPVVDFDTKRPKADANGAPLYSFQVVAYAPKGAQLLLVSSPASRPPASRAGCRCTSPGSLLTPGRETASPA